MTITITFDNNYKKDILAKVLNKEINDEDVLTDKTTGEVVLNAEGETMGIEDFGLFENGSEIFVKKDIASLMEYCSK